MNNLSRDILRLLDANLNRAVEGIRILEETARMIMNNCQITAEIKELRHSLVAVSRQENMLNRNMLLARDSEHDILRNGETDSERTRTDLDSIIRANAGRAQEAVRGLEEYVKLVYPTLSVQYKLIRFRLYDIEKTLIVLLHKQNLTSRERLGVYVIIDYERFSKKNITDSAEMLAGAGAGTIVFRDKISCDRDFMRSAESIVSVCKKNSISIMINDRPDIALITEADGVLIGSYDISVASCKKISGQEFMTGFSLYHDSNDDSELSGDADYLLSKPITGDTQSINDLRYLVSEYDTPVVAFCGDNPKKWREILESGVAGIGFMPEFKGGYHEIEQVISTIKKHLMAGSNH
ncbi:MAG: thiamine phosphate synthase [Candidatus Latescibacterota bacterium]